MADRRLGTAACVLAIAVIASGCPMEDFGPLITTPTSIQAVSGGGQEAVVGSALPNPLSVRVNGSEGAIANVPVTWSVVAGGGSVSASTSVTDGNGTAQTNWTLGTAAGEQTVRASVAGVSVGADFSATARPGPAVTLSLSETDLLFTSLGETVTLMPGAEDEHGNDFEPEGAWSSTNTAVATVTSGGMVRAESNGQATIRFSSNGLEAQASVEVAAPGPVATIAVSPAQLAFDHLGEAQSLAAEARDAEGLVVFDAEFEWVSSNPAVATVDADGRVVAEGAGSAAITASAEGVTSNEVAVTVEQATVTLSVSPGFLPLGTSGGAALGIEARDAGGALIAQPEFTSTSRNSTIVTTDGAQVTPGSLGVADVVVTSQGVSDSARVAVVAQDGFAFLATTDPAEALLDVEPGTIVDLELWLIRPPAGTGGLGSISGTLAWDPAVLDYGGSAAVADGFSWTPNETDTAVGELEFGAFAAEGISESFLLARVTFTVVGSQGAGSGLSLEVSAAGNADGSTNITDLIQAVDTHVEVQP